MLRDGLNFYCINCCAEIEPCLAGLCSMRCHDCRDAVTDDRSFGEAPVVREDVEPWPVWFARTQGVPARAV